MNMVVENCYIISDESKEAIIIDCGAYGPKNEALISEYIEKENLVPVHQIYTHAHFDHVFGCNFISENYHILPECHEADVALYMNMKEQHRMFLGSDDDVRMPPLGRILTEGDKISFGTHTLEVIHIPGHTPGGVCFYEQKEQVLFTGDSLFQMSIGRTDFPGGSYAALTDSLKKKITVLPDNVKVYPGHGPTTTVGFEKENNPYLS